MTDPAAGHRSTYQHGQAPTPFEADPVLAALTQVGLPARPGEGDPRHPDGPVDWHGMLEEDLDPTLDALADFLAWAVPRWGFTSEQFPYGCWWQHPDIVEEMTAWWGMWQAYIRNPSAHPADPMAFHERTYALKLRLSDTYRGRCRREHTAPPSGTVARPDI